MHYLSIDWQQLWSFNRLDKNGKLNEPHKQFMETCLSYGGNYMYETITAVKMRFNNYIYTYLQQVLSWYFVVYTEKALSLRLVRNKRNKEQPEDGWWTEQSHLVV